MRCGGQTETVMAGGWDGWMDEPAKMTRRMRRRVLSRHVEVNYICDELFSVWRSELPL